MKRLQELRKSRNITQLDLANKLNVSRNTVSRYEIGNREPDYDTLKQLAEFFDVSIDYLLDQTSDPSPSHANKEAPAEITAEALREIAEEVAGRPLTHDELIVLHTRVDDLVATIDKLAEEKK